LIEHGKNGFLVSGCEEAVEHIIRINDINRSDCRRTVEDRFTADSMVEKYIDVYTQVLQKAPED
jgi:glycosyltransferase involved in cell wall biosynthesis